MFTNFAEFITCVKEARFTFEYIWQKVLELFHAIAGDRTISLMWDSFMEAIEPVHMMVMTLATIFCLVIAFFGKKMLGFMKFGFFFLLGFVLGTHFLAPLIPPEVSIPAWLVGLVLAIIAGVLSRFAYIISYVGIVGYSIYILAYYGFYLKLDATYSTSRAVACVIIALIVVIISLVFRKYCEMGATAVLGAWCSVWLFTHCIYDFRAWAIFSGYEDVAVGIIVAIISVLGTIVQIKTRRRY